jgi:hypothetical protein
MIRDGTALINLGGFMRYTITKKATAPPARIVFRYTGFWMWLWTLREPGRKAPIAAATSARTILKTKN